MKTILHSDYWIEIPAGEFLVGLSDRQRNLISTHIRNQVGYEQFSRVKQQLVESIITKIRQRAERAHRAGKPSVTYPLELTDEEKSIRSLERVHKIVEVEYTLLSVPDQRSVWIDLFYVAIFPITESQYSEFRQGKPAKSWSGTIERPHEGGAIVQTEKAIRLCQELGGRFPTILEWEKAARGTDGRLYPWGNDWDPEAGYFFRRQAVPKGGWVTGLSRGVSPFGVWGMAGGLPELVMALEPQPHVAIKGCHPKESSAEMAWFDHIVARIGRGGWVSVRPVLDKWPIQQWPGFQKKIGPKDSQ